MSRSRVIAIWLLLVCSVAYGQQAIIFQLPSGAYVGFATIDGRTIPLTDITILKVPGPAPNPTGFATHMIVLRDQKTATTKQVAVLLDLQEKYQRGTKPEVFVLDRTEPSSVTQRYVSLKPATAAFPYYFLTDKEGKVLAHGVVAPTTAENEAIIAKYQEKK